MFFYDVLLFNIENWEDDDKPWNWWKLPTIFRQTCELSSAAGSILNNPPEAVLANTIRPE
jgi:hypothetical protein